MRNAGGYAVITTPVYDRINLDRLSCEEIHAGMNELDTFSCFHCGRVIHVKPKIDPASLGGLCKTCMKLICPDCVTSGKCDPFEKKLERAEARYHALRSYGL